MDGLSEVAPGKFFASVRRPAGVENFPYRVVFDSLDVVDARHSHHARQHRHDHYEVILVEGGTYRFHLNQRAGRIHRNGVLVLKPGDWHEDLCDGAVMFSAMRIRVLPGPTPTSSASVFAEGAPDSAQIITASDGACHRVVHRLFAAGRRADPFTTQLLDAMAMEFVWELVRALPRTVLAPRLLAGLAQHGFAGDLIALFERHLGVALGLREMAAGLGLSERTLSARCRAAFGCSPTRLFVQRKMEHARHLLLQTDLPVKEISAFLGFENPYHVSTVYKRVHGVPPSKARGSIS
jgi:AraC-like DNA-binding protein